MRILIIGGNAMHTDDGSAYWTLKPRLEAMGHEVEIRECIETARNSVVMADSDAMVWAEAVIAYSYGVASTWHLLHENQPTPEASYEMLVIVAGVPDLFLGQMYVNLWHAPKIFKRAVCFQVNDIPASCDLQGASAASLSKVGELPGNYNVYCDYLFPAVTPPSFKHVAVKEHPQVLAAIASLFPAAPPPGPALCAADVSTGNAPPDAPAPLHDGDAGAPTTQGGAA